MNEYIDSGLTNAGRYISILDDFVTSQCLYLFEQNGRRHVRNHLFIFLFRLISRGE